MRINYKLLYLIMILAGFIVLPVQAATLYSWDFETDGDLGPWTTVNLDSVAVSGGILSASATTGDAQLNLAGGSIDVNTSLPGLKLEIRIKQNVTLDQIAVYCHGNGAFADGFPGGDVNVQSVAPAQLGQWDTVIIDFNRYGGSKITGFRIDPVAGAAGDTFDLDYIRVTYDVPVPTVDAAWEFNTDADFEGWTINNAAASGVAGGMLSVTAAGDLQLYQSGLSITPLPNMYIESLIRPTGGDIAQMWIQGPFTELGRPIPVANEWQIIRHSLTRFGGETMTQIRYDVTAGDRSVDIDYIRVAHYDDATDLAEPHAPSPGNWEKILNTDSLSFRMARDPEDMSQVHPDVVKHYIYMLAAQDPNFTDPATVVIESTDLTDVVTVSPTLAEGTLYHWTVVESTTGNGLITDANNIIGDIWSFETLPPIVNDVVGPVDSVVFPTETAVFMSDFTSTSAPTATWKKVGTPDTEYGTVSLGAPSMVVGNVTLTLVDNGAGSYTTICEVANASSADEGLYYCVLDNTANAPQTSDQAELILKELVAHYEFEGDLTDSAGDVDGVPMDIDGPNTVAYDTGIIGSQSLLLDGTNYVELSTEAYPKAGAGNGMLEGSMSVWIKADPNTTGSFYGALNDGGNTAFTFSIEAGEQLRIYVRADGGLAAGHSTPVATLLDDGDWHMVSAAWDILGNAFSLYIDGDRVHTGTTGTSTFADWQYPMFIGGNNSRTTPTQLFAGQLDDIRVYNYAVDKRAMADLYIAGKPGSEICFEDEFSSAFDFVEDCVINIEDFAAFAATWLECGLYPASECQ